MGFHLVGPGAVIPAAVVCLATDHGQQQFSLEQAVDLFASCRLQSAVQDEERVGIILGADLPVVRPGVAVFIHPAVDQMDERIRRSLYQGVRSPQHVGLLFDWRQRCQFIDDIVG